CKANTRRSGAWHLEHSRYLQPTQPLKGMSQKRYNQLIAEAQAPYKGFRKFIYGSIGASGAIGAFVFFTKILAGRDIAASLPNLALQLGIVALMIFLFRWEDRDKEES
ncbi:MAG: DUF3493 domain-containing protein, partial [Cyanobacteria bacterium J06576_12]